MVKRLRVRDRRLTVGDRLGLGDTAEAGLQGLAGAKAGAIMT